MKPITKQTIAIIGSSSPVGTALAKGLCRENYRLLLFEQNSDESKILSDEIYSSFKEADVEVLECTHHASWEADIIYIEYQEPELKKISEKIKNVSTQKLIAVRLRGNNENDLKKAESYFPNSKVVGLIPSTSDPDSVILLSEHARALPILQEMLSHAGFNVTSKELISG